MNITEAKKIPINILVEALGGRYAHTDRKGDIWYFSPFRPEEKTASFKINVKLNQWHDFGLANTLGHQKQGSGGDILDLWCDFNFKNRRFGINEALVALQTLVSYSKVSLASIKTAPIPITIASAPRYKILNIADVVTHAGLKEELNRRRISRKLAEMYLKQGVILDTVTDKKFTGFLFENDKGGYEVSIPNPKKNECFKTCIGPKASTRILVNDNVDSADIFEGFWDMLSWLEMRKMYVPRNHTYILNSTSLVVETCERIIHFKDNIEFVFLFMDNDEAGYQATHAIAAILQEENFKVGSCEQIYKGHKDLNEFWANSPEAKNIEP